MDEVEVKVGRIWNLGSSLREEAGARVATPLSDPRISGRLLAAWRGPVVEHWVCRTTGPRHGDKISVVWLLDSYFDVLYLKASL